MTPHVESVTPTDGNADALDVNSSITQRTRFEQVLAVLILLEAAHILYYWYPDLGFIADDQLTSLGRLIWPALTAASLYSNLRRPWLERRSLDPLILAPIVLLAASFIWSVDAFRSLYQSIVLAAVLACGWFLAIAYTRRELVALVSHVFGIACAVSVAATFAGIDNRTGQTTGLFEHKNIFGPVAAVGLLFAVARLAAGERGRLLTFVASSTAIALFLSGSRTSQFATVLMLLIAVLAAVRRENPRAALALAAPMVAVVALGLRAAGGLSAIFVASGKSSDLTGRTDIWATVASLVMERPVLGWGYLAYWRDEGFAGGGRSGFEEFGLRSAHNGYLETALGAGAVAGALVAIGLITLVVRSLRRSTELAPRSGDIALASLAGYCLVANMSEAIYPASTLVLATLLILALSAGPRNRERR